MLSYVLKLRSRATWGIPLIALATIGIISTGLVAQGHWELIEDDPNAAVAAKTCPESAGLVPISDCTSFSGFPAFDLGTGALDQVYVTRATDLPDNYEWQEDLDDGWRIALMRY